jgi:hypothetical protein
MIFSEINYLITQFDKLDKKKFPGSMSHIEILIFIFLCIANKIEVVVESGRQYGYSTFFISLFCKKNKIKFVSIDYETNLTINNFSRKILKNNKVIYKKNNFYTSINNIFDEFKEKKLALLVDGPKGTGAHIKTFFLAKKFNNFIFCFFDNMPNSNLSAKKLFMYSTIYCFNKIYNINNLKNSSENNFQAQKFSKNIIFKKLISIPFNRKEDFEFAYVFAKDIKKSTIVYVRIFFFIIMNKLVRIFLKIKV